jgi:hypothetical protein
MLRLTQPIKVNRMYNISGELKITIKNDYVIRPLLLDRGLISED